MRNARRRTPLLALGALTAALMLPSAAQADTFTINGPGVAIPDNSSTTSSVTVSGFTGTISHATAALGNVVHLNGADIDSAIVAPNGVAVYLMGDACAGMISESLVFADEAPINLQSAVPCNTGPYKPTNLPPGVDDPVPGAFNMLSFFNGIDPNGTWTLVIADDTATNTGSLGSWSLTLDGLGVVTTTTPPGNPTSPINPAGHLRKRKCKKKQKTAGAEIAKRKKCKKKKKR